jgi:hypothetical protein
LHEDGYGGGVALLLGNHKRSVPVKSSSTTPDFQSRLLVLSCYALSLMSKDGTSHHVSG